MNIWFTSDPHYFHKNVIKYCKRPYDSVEEMNDRLIENWHSVVKTGDHVFILGDFTFCGLERAKEIVQRLRGDKKIKITLVRGNHDRGSIACFKMGFDDVVDETTFYWSGRKFTLSHFPYAPTKWDLWKRKLINFVKFWKRVEKVDVRYLDHRPVDDGRWLFHGHVHNAWKVKRRMINVGVDVWGYRPVNIKELAAIIRKRET